LVAISAIPELTDRQGTPLELTKGLGFRERLDMLAASDEARSITAVLR
jgi:hypothetical protein